MYLVCSKGAVLKPGKEVRIDLPGTAQSNKVSIWMIINNVQGGYALEKFERFENSPTSQSEPDMAQVVYSAGSGQPACPIGRKC
jgi:hypothetical protein